MSKAASGWYPRVAFPFAVAEGMMAIEVAVQQGLGRARMSTYSGEKWKYMFLLFLIGYCITTK